MLNRVELADALNKVARGSISLDEFRDWFEEASWNVHRKADDELTAAVFRAESLLSAVDEQRLNEKLLAQKFADLATAIRPFVYPERKPPQPERPQEMYPQNALFRERVRF